MKLEDRNIENIDMDEEYEMIPFEPMMNEYGQMNNMQNMGMNQSMGMNSNMGMPGGYMQEGNLNMEMDPWMGMNPYMGMDQFNENISMNGYNPMAMMYGDTPMEEFDNENELERQIDKYGDKEPFKDGHDKPNKFNPKKNDVDSIVRRIERYNPAIFRMMTRYGMPYAQAREIVRRIVRLTLMYSDE